MTDQISPDQVELLLVLSTLTLLMVSLRLIGLAVWHRWLKDDGAPDNLTQAERDEQLVRRRR